MFFIKLEKWVPAKKNNAINKFPEVIFYFVSTTVILVKKNCVNNAVWGGFISTSTELKKQITQKGWRSADLFVWKMNSSKS